MPVDPLKDITLDLSSEISIEDTLRKRDEGVDLDSTIVIGDIDGGTMFDDISRSPKKGTPQVSQEELEDLMTSVKLKHRADVDAVMLEQAAYKRIIRGLVRKLKVQKSEIDKKDLKLQELAKFKQQTANLTQLNAKVTADLSFYR